MDESGNGVAVDSSGNVYVAGSTQSFGFGGADALLLKFNSSGSLLWARTWGGGSFDAAYDVAFDSSGGGTNALVVRTSFAPAVSATLPVITAFQNAATFKDGGVDGSWVQIKGSNLAPTRQLVVSGITPIPPTRLRCRRFSME